MLVFFLATSFRMAGQHPDKKTLKLFEQARSAYQSGHSSVAEVLLSKLFHRDTLFAKAYLLLGDLKAEKKQWQQAIRSYRKALSMDSVSWPAAFFVLARWEYRMGDYTAAAKDIRYYLHLVKGASLPRVERADKLLENVLFAEKAAGHPEKVHLQMLDKPVNSRADEYVNFVDAGQNELVFTRKSKSNRNGRKTYSEYFYRSVRKNGHWQAPVRMAFPWDTTLNMGAMSLSADGRTMFFTGCGWPHGLGRCDIYTSKKRGSHWQFPQNLGRPVNTSGWESQAVISANGKALFFASKRPGGKGGSDLWMCRKLSDGRWGKPVNLGDSINTPGNEMSPFLFADGRTLYFSSDGWPGLGGYDLFVARKKSDDTWSKAVNLGYPVNSRANEINLFVALARNKAWISSDRTEGNFNIYAFAPTGKMVPEKVLYVEGVVVDSVTGKRLGAKVLLTDLSEGKRVDSVVSDPVTGRFLLVLPVEKNYAFHIEKQGYLFYSRHFDLKKHPELVSVKKVFRLVKIHAGAVMPLHNILFGFDSAQIRSEAFPELKRLVRFMKEYPDIKILIAGYTDNRGSTAYNLKLSSERARAVFRYLVSHGVQAERMQYKGFGQSHPLTGNATSSGRALNRRTEIVIR